ncbi:ABC transporter permease [Opitutus sp. GAS368]|jgi:lipoprotein-releasing system permease protein|uniref:ABC transporter permease n=1 Tax=Opitutus sp. GAS368 TaxID=1882749 RepID=UPI00087995E5|nr:ABC transporter permease [Opitutus sp. GAS368]SDR70499.1 lipoprotein-releasing system permease protein [Opitutus sp. GAS368]
MPWPVYLALKQLFPSGRRVPFFTLISVLGVALGVALMLVTMSVMGGFGHQIKTMIIDTQGEVQVKASLLLDRPAAAEVEKTLAATPGVQAFAPYAAGMVMLEYQNRPAFPAIQGFNYAQMKKVVPLDRYLTAGSLEQLDDDSIILSSILANSLGAGVGDTVSIYSPLALERARKNELLLPRDVRVAGIFAVGHQQLDSSTVLCSLRLMQDLYGLEQRVHGYNVRLQPGADEYAVAAALNRQLPADTRAQTWFESNADFQAVLAFERNMIFFLLTFIIVVAAFSITSSLLVTVVRKTREIGLLGAMGGRARHIAACFCVQGLVIGLGGTTLGLGLGFGLLHYRNAVVHLIAGLTMGQEVFEKFYQFSSLPANTEPRDVVLIIGFSIVASTIAGLIPAWRAAKLQPVEALRSE